MMIIKCKMCGGDLHPAENATTCECEFCGTVQTLPKLDNDRRANLYDRANHFRRSNEYDKAMSIFEQILQEDRTDAEAYWSLVLCRYGIEYVEDPTTHKRVPTVNRVQFTSILADEDYHSALEYADAEQKRLYEAEAKTIDGIQKGILEISKKEKPFDVFICYKETDVDGKRTPDSVLANDLYHQLTREGFKVFFSRITLEDKLGQQYEPYIFAALNSAKVMVVLGTKPEYFNAVWVKNEWSRYLSLIKAGANKTLVPAYKDMDPYDLPEEFSHLQAQDMSKLGFMQDLIHGIKKLSQSEKPAEPVVIQQTVTGANGSNLNALLDRAFMALEDGEWEKADDFCEKALNLDARNARAYVGKLLAEKKVRREEDLTKQSTPLENSGNYQKALRFADAKQKAQLENANTACRNNQLQLKLQAKCDQIMSSLRRADSVQAVQDCKDAFAKLTGYAKVKEAMQECDKKIEAIYSRVYAEANKLMQKGNYTAAAEKFRSISDYRDSAATAVKCEQLDRQEKARIAAENEEIARAAQAKKAKEEAERKERERVAQELRAREEEIARRKAEAKAAKMKKLTIIGIAAAMVCIAIFFIATKVIMPMSDYNSAAKLLENGQYTDAMVAFAALGDYSDSKVRIEQAKADIAFDRGNYQEVGDIYATLPEKYQDHADDLNAIYNEAVAQMDAGNYDDAIAAFTGLGNYSDSTVQMNEAAYRKAGVLAASGEREAAKAIYKALNDYSDSKEKQKQIIADEAYDDNNYIGAWSVYASLPEQYQTHNADYEAMYTAANNLLTAGNYDEAQAQFASLGSYSDSPTMKLECQYQKAGSLTASGDYDTAIDLYDSLKDYKDSDTLLTKAKADKLYDAGSYAEAYDIYTTLDAAYQTHAADYEAMYASATQSLSAGDYDSAYDLFIALGNYSDASTKAAQCGTDKANALFAAEKYDEAADVYTFIGDEANAQLSTYRYAVQMAEKGEYKLAADAYFSIVDYEDSREQHYQMGLQARVNGKLADACSILTEDIDYRDAKESVYQTGVTASNEQLYEVSVPCFTAVGAYKDAAMKLTMDTYAWGGQLYDNGSYDQSAEVFASMGDFSDAATRANEASYAAAEDAMNAGNYDEAAKRFAALGDYSDSADKALAARYAAANELLESGNYADAKARFNSLGNYSNSADMVKECDYRPAMNLFHHGDYTGAKAAFLALGDYSDSTDMAKECDYIPAKALYDTKNYAEALEAFTANSLSGYKDASALMNDCNYQLAQAAMAEADYEKAVSLFDAAGTYSDSEAQAAECRRLIAVQKGAEYEANNDYESAYAQYEQANETDKMSEMAYQTAKAKLTTSDYAGAISWFEKAGYGYNDVNEKILSIGEYYYSTQQYDEAEAVYVKVVDTGVAAQRLYELGQYYELVGDLEHAAKAYGEAGNYEDALAKAEATQMEADYQTAESLYAAGNYEEAKTAYAKVSGYKDVDSKLIACDNGIAAAAAAAAAALDAKFTVGNYVEFGTYPQTASGTDNTPIEWQVLARDGNWALLISRYGLDAQPYNTTYTSVTWETCTLRTWLNSTFMNKAFTKEEQKAILTANVDNSSSQGYSGWSTSGGNNTKDQIFLLSYAEANKYFGVTYSDSNNTKARVQPTAYAEKQGAYTSSSNKTADGDNAGWWWLRSPGGYRSYAASVYYDGSLLNYRVYYDRGCVRPALWVNLESGIF